MFNSKIVLQKLTDMMKLVDMLELGSSEYKLMWVQVPLSVSPIRRFNVLSDRI